jgi:hypothetical protein
MASPPGSVPGRDFGGLCIFENGTKTEVSRRDAWTCTLILGGQTSDGAVPDAALHCVQSLKDSIDTHLSALTALVLGKAQVQLIVRDPERCEETPQFDGMSIVLHGVIQENSQGVFPARWRSGGTPVSSMALLATGQDPQRTTVCDHPVKISHYVDHNSTLTRPRPSCDACALRDGDSCTLVRRLDAGWRRYGPSAACSARHTWRP